jgi:hypothetical protein
LQIYVCAENPLECWVFEMMETLNKQTKTAVSKAWRSVKGNLGMDISKDSRKVICDQTTDLCV